MRQPGQAPSEQELHAYIDGGLDPARRLEVAVYLARHPGDAARGEAFRAQKEGIRALFDHVLDQPVPEHLRFSGPDGGRRRRWRCLAWMMAAGSVAFILALCWLGASRGPTLLPHDAVMHAPDRQTGTLLQSAPADFPQRLPRPTKT